METLELRIEILIHRLNFMRFTDKDHKVIALNVIRYASTSPTDQEIKKEIETFYQN